MRKRTIASWHLAAWSTLPTTSRTSACARPVTEAGAKPVSKPFSLPPSPISNAWLCSTCSNEPSSPPPEPLEGDRPTGGSGQRRFSPLQPSLTPSSRQSRRSGRRKRCADNARDRTSNQAFAARSPRSSSQEFASFRSVFLSALHPSIGWLRSQAACSIMRPWARAS